MIKNRRKGKWGKIGKKSEEEERVQLRIGEREVEWKRDRVGGECVFGMFLHTVRLIVSRYGVNGFRRRPCCLLNGGKASLCVDYRAEDIIVKREV